MNQSTAIPDDASDAPAMSERPTLKYKKGWPKGKTRTPRPEAVQAIRQVVATPRPGIRSATERLKELRENSVINDDEGDRFYVDPRIVKEYQDAGWSLEWKAHTIVGKEDPASWGNKMRKGWEPVPRDQHPGLLTETDGQILCMRPKVLTDETHKRYENADRERTGSIRQRLSATPGGTLPRTGSSVTRTAEPIVIPKE